MLVDIGADLATALRGRAGLLPICLPNTHGNRIFLSGRWGLLESDLYSTPGTSKLRREISIRHSVTVEEVKLALRFTYEPEALVAEPHDLAQARLTCGLNDNCVAFGFKFLDCTGVFLGPECLSSR